MCRYEQSEPQQTENHEDKHAYHRSREMRVLHVVGARALMDERRAERLELEPKEAGEESQPGRESDISPPSADCILSRRALRRRGRSTRSWPLRNARLLHPVGSSGSGSAAATAPGTAIWRARCRRSTPSTGIPAPRVQRDDVILRHARFAHWTVAATSLKPLHEAKAVSALTATARVCPRPTHPVQAWPAAAVQHRAAA